MPQSATLTTHLKPELKTRLDKLVSITHPLITVNNSWHRWMYGSLLNWVSGEFKNSRQLSKKPVTMILPATRRWNGIQGWFW